MENQLIIFKLVREKLFWFFEFIFRFKGGLNKTQDF